jgi:hypothetical protein
MTILFLERKKRNLKIKLKIKIAEEYKKTHVGITRQRGKTICGIKIKILIKSICAEIKGAETGYNLRGKSKKNPRQQIK